MSPEELVKEFEAADRAGKVWEWLRKISEDDFDVLCLLPEYERWKERRRSERSDPEWHDCQNYRVAFDSEYDACEMCGALIPLERYEG